MTTQMTIEGIVISYPTLFKPRKFKRKDGKEEGDPKYSLVCLLPEDFDWKASDDACDLAAEKTFSEVVTDDYKTPFFQPDKAESRVFEGQWALRCYARENDKPTIVEPDLTPLVDASHVFAGVIANVQVNFWAIDVSGRRIMCDISLIQLVDYSSDKIKRLDGRKSVKEVFKPIKGAPKALGSVGSGGRSQRGGSRGDRGQSPRGSGSEFLD